MGPSTCRRALRQRCAKRTPTSGSTMPWQITTRSSLAEVRSRASAGQGPCLSIGISGEADTGFRCSAVLGTSVLLVWHPSHLVFAITCLRLHLVWRTAEPTERGCVLAAGLVVEGYTPEQVEEVRMVIRLLPIFLTTILYWTVYSQMGTFFVLQARPGRSLCCHPHVSAPERKQPSGRLSAEADLPSAPACATLQLAAVQKQPRLHRFVFALYRPSCPWLVGTGTRRSAL